MGTGTKVTLAFLGGAITGAAVLAYLNRDKLDWEKLKPGTAELLGKIDELKAGLLAKLSSLKEDLEKVRDSEDLANEDKS